jgi:hypothetical protein
MARGGALGVLALAGGALITLRGATNLEIGRSLGLAGGRHAIDVEKTAEIGQPLHGATTADASQTTLEDIGGRVH